MIGISGSASLQSAGKSWFVAFTLALSPYNSQGKRECVPFHMAEFLMLVQKVEVGLTTRAGIDDGGKVK